MRIVSIVFLFALLSNIVSASTTFVQARSFLKEKKYKDAADVLIGVSQENLSPEEVRERYSLLLTSYAGMNEKAGYDAICEEIFAAKLQDILSVDQLVLYARNAYKQKKWDEALRRYDAIFTLRPNLSHETSYLAKNGKRKPLDQVEYERVRSACNIRPENMIFFRRGEEYLQKYKAAGRWEDEVTFQLAWRKFHDKPQEAAEDLKSFLDRFPHSRKHAFASILLFRLLSRLGRYDEFFLAVRTYGVASDDPNVRADVLMNTFLAFRKMSRTDDSTKYANEDLENAFYRSFINMNPTKVNMVQRMEQMMLVARQPDFQGALADINYFLSKDPKVFERADPLSAGNYGALQHLYACALFHHSPQNAYVARNFLAAVLNNNDYKTRQNPFYEMSQILLNKIDAFLVTHP